MTRLSIRTAALATIITDRWPAGTEARLVDDLAARLPRTIAQLAMATPDGYPSSTPGASERGGPSGSSSSPDRIGNLIARRSRAVEAYAHLTELLGTATAAAAVADRQGVRRALSDALGVTDEWQPPAPASVKAALTCSRWTVQDTGVDDWVDPLCQRIADVGRSGLCEACWRRRHRWMARRATVEGAG